MTGRCVVLFAGVCSLFWAIMSSAQTPARSDNPENAHILSLAWAPEVHARQDIGAIAAGQAGLDFQPMPADRNLGFQEKPVWIHAGVDLPADKSRYLLTINYTQLDRIEAYWQEDGQWVRHVTGDKLPFIKHTESKPQPVFKLPRVSGRFDVYFRIEMSGSLQFPLNLWNAEQYASHFSDLQFFTGLYFSVLGTMMLYNLFLFTAMRDPAYLYLSGYLAGLLGFQAAYSGHAAMYLWPYAESWAHVSTLSLLSLCVASGNMFVHQMLGSGKVVPSTRKILPPLTWAALATIVLITLDYSLALKAFLLVAGLAVLYYPWPIFIAFFRGYRPARFMVLGLVCIVPGALLLIGRYLDWLPLNFWTQNSLKFGTAAEALIFSFAVADRVNLLREERDEAQARLVETEQRALAVQRNYSRRLLEAQDTERKRLARELHDGFGQMMASVSNTIKRWMKSEAKPDQSDLSDLSSMNREIMNDLRAISHNLHPHQLDRLGLKAALLSVLGQAENNGGLRIHHQVDDVERLLSPETKLHVYRLAQEAINNVLRHADASLLELSLQNTDGELLLEIIDNGKGLQNLDQQSGLGMNNMRERARVIGGKLEITGDSGGTAVRLTIPVNGAAA